MVILKLLLGGGGEAIHNIDVRTNMWITWANQTNQESFCLALQSALDPFQTCLIGVLWGFQWSIFINYVSNTVGLSANLTTLCKTLGVSSRWTMSCSRYRANTGAEDALRMSATVNSLKSR